jgi:hypothetical protein
MSTQLENYSIARLTRKRERPANLDGWAVLALEAAREVPAVGLRRRTAVKPVRTLVDVDVALLSFPRVLAGTVVHLADAAPGAMATGDAGPVPAGRACAAVDRLLAVLADEATWTAARSGPRCTQQGVQSATSSPTKRLAQLPLPPHHAHLQL